MARQWTEDEVTLLEYYAREKTSIPKIKEFFPGRSVMSIYAKARWLGLTLGHKQTPARRTWPVVFLHVDPETKSRIDQLSKDYGLPRGEVLTQALLWFHQALYPEERTTDNVADAAE